LGRVINAGEAVFVERESVKSKTGIFPDPGQIAAIIEIDDIGEDGPGEIDGGEHAIFQRKAVKADAIRVSARHHPGIIDYFPKRLVGVGKVKNPDVGAVLHITVNGPGHVMEEASHLAKVINATNRCGGRSWDINVLKPEVACKNLG
jgi:hypothetical protein